MDKHKHLIFWRREVETVAAYVDATTPDPEFGFDWAELREYCARMAEEANDAGFANVAQQLAHYADIAEAKANAEAHALPVDTFYPWRASQ